MRPYIITMIVKIRSAITVILVTLLGLSCVRAESGAYGSVIIGRTAEQRLMRAYSIGTGSRQVIIFGGIHGGYEWNTIVLVRGLRDYLKSNPDLIPENVRLRIIPEMNVDGLHMVTDGRPISEIDIASRNTIPGRFNANGVDLNRNWGTGDWQPESYWGARKVDAGDRPFSEPETHTQIELDRNLDGLMAVLELVSRSGS